MPMLDSALCPSAIDASLARNVLELLALFAVLAGFEFAMYDGVREWAHTAKGDRRHMMGHTSSNDWKVVRTISPDHPSDLPQAINGFYGLRIARTVVGP